jgi:hypothetical protein
VTTDPTKLDDALLIVDEYLGPDPVPAPPHVTQAWMTIRGELRRRRRQSSQTLQAVGPIAQHVALAKEHSQKALDAMSGVFGGEVDPKDG